LVAVAVAHKAAPQVLVVLAAAAAVPLIKLVVQELLVKEILVVMDLTAVLLMVAVAAVELALLAQ
jgi:hypothetical protein